MAQGAARTCRCSPTPTGSRRRRRRSARSSRSSPTGSRRQLRRVEGADYLGKLNGATGTYGAHLAAVPDADWPTVIRVLRRVPRPDVEPADHADREPRLAGRALRRHRPVQPGAAQPLHRRRGPTSRWATSRRCAGRARSAVVDDAAQGQPDPLRERRGQPRAEQRPARRALGSTLVQSRLQRDLTDSSMQRNIGSAFGHSVLALDNVCRGLAGLDAVPAAMAADLDGNWEVLGEAVQSAMRALAARGVSGHGEALRAAQGADPWAADRRGRPARLRRRSGPAGRRRRAAARR